MASKKKKAADKGKQVKKVLKKTGSATGKETAAKKRKATAELTGNGEIREFVVEARSGSTKIVRMEVLKKERYSSSGRKFEIRILKNEQRKLLVYDVIELTKTEFRHLINLRMEIRMTDLKAKPEEVRGYKEVLQMVKHSIDTFADSLLNNVKKFVWSQFGAAMDMLQQAIRCWPDSEWETDKRFFYISYHTLVFLDYYLGEPVPKFSSKLPFTLTDTEAIPAEALDDVIPNRIYSKTELLDYGELLRWKCKSSISLLTGEQTGDRWIEKGGDMNYGKLEILLYNMRHVQHHAAQLNMLLRRKINDAPKWIGRVADELT